MSIPKIIFEPMSLQDNIEIVKWSYFEDNESLDIHKYTVQYYPELANIDPNKSKEEIYDLIEKIVSNNYEKYKEKILNEVQKYNKTWEPYNEKYFVTLSKYLNTSFPEGLEIIRANVGFIPVFPRYLDTFSFSVSTNISELDIIRICAHETCHFLWFKKWKELYPDCPRREYDSPYIPWQYSEMVVEPILNSKEINSILQIREKAYDSFYEIKDENNLCIMDGLKDLYDEDVSIEEKIKSGYNYVCSILQKGKVR